MLYNTIYKKYQFPETVKPILKYYAYKDGTATTFDTLDQAKQHSKLVESVITNSDDVDHYRATVNSINNLIYHEWESALREHYNNVSEKVFDKCMSMAYDRGHSAGYDEVESYLGDYINFAIDIINI